MLMRRLFRHMTRSLLATCCVAGVPQTSSATETGVGRPITGQQITPYGGIVPSTDEWIVSWATIYYEGSLSANKTVSTGNHITGGLNYQVVYTIANLVKTWGVSLAGWNFASSIGVPVQYSNASSFNGLLRPDHGTQFADLFFVPVIAGYHLSPTDHAALSLQIYAPTGAYNPGRLANAGQNTWTFTPNIAYTKLFPKHDIELTVNYGIEFYTTNNDTHYHNAPVSVLDVLALKRFGNGWNVGLVGGWIQQLGNDTGPTADALDGAKGYSVGMGPMVGWTGKLGKTPVSANLRWVNEFATHARPAGNAVQLSLSASFE
ncbi:transporter [Burkholderia sp. Ac-20365]|uniref:SphA family protein n=1 Tax=Burkholderia sp. Ac-20365 TaxID=2703897 RepID=UPI00197C4525|nr:transporter [Burkholderia sp. Ac-20365]MBN3762987.1 transporter [Burkholderia sp. Ac-20365]